MSILPRDSTRVRGTRIEEAAAKFLIDQGLELLARNVHYRVGEIDLIFHDPIRRERVFVEVRGRSSPDARETPLESLRFRKRIRLRRAIELYLSRMERTELKKLRGVRVDLVGWTGHGWEWIRDLQWEEGLRR